MLGHRTVAPGAAAEPITRTSQLVGSQSSIPIGDARDRCHLEISVQRDVVTFKTIDPARAGQIFDYSVDNFRFVTRFDATGRLDASGPLLQENTRLGWKAGDGTACATSIDADTLPDTVATALVWSGRYELDLHVREPNGASLSRAQPSTASLGQVQSFGTPGGGRNGTRVLLYSAPRSRLPSGSGTTLYFDVEFVSRGNPAQPPWCGADMAQVEFQMFHVDTQQVEPPHGFGAVPCGQSWPSAADAFARIKRKY